jgi:hypothetical protein
MDLFFPRSQHSRIRLGLGVLLALVVGGAGFLAMRPSARTPVITGNPMGGLEHTATDGQPFEGKVQEQLRAGPYTYCSVRRDDGALVWVVTMGRGEPPGTRVQVVSFGRRTDFPSSRLNRTFAELCFGTVSRVR